MFSRKLFGAETVNCKYVNSCGVCSKSFSIKTERRSDLIFIDYLKERGKGLKEERKTLFVE